VSAAAPSGAAAAALFSAVAAAAIKARRMRWTTGALRAAGKRGCGQSERSKREQLQ